jgi:hypothetical protein
LDIEFHSKMLCWFLTHILLGILIFKGLTARRLYKSLGVKGLILSPYGQSWLQSGLFLSGFTAKTALYFFILTMRSTYYVHHLLLLLLDYYSSGLRLPKQILLYSFRSLANICHSGYPILNVFTFVILRHENASIRRSQYAYFSNLLLHLFC